MKFCGLHNHTIKTLSISVSNFFPNCVKGHAILFTQNCQPLVGVLNYVILKCIREHNKHSTRRSQPTTTNNIKKGRIISCKIKKKYNLNNKLSATCVVLFGFFFVLNYDCKVHTTHIHQGEHHQSNKKKAKKSLQIFKSPLYLYIVRLSIKSGIYMFFAFFSMNEI